jgi:hypothetical protein
MFGRKAALVTALMPSILVMQARWPCEQTPAERTVRCLPRPIPWT